MIEQKHIIASYDKDLKNLKKRIRRMATLADKQISRTSKAIRKGDGAAASKVVSKDRKLNELEGELTEEVTKILALRQPMAGDLRLVLAALKIAGNLERIGNHTKNTASRTGGVEDSPALDAVKGNIKRMSKQVRKMLADVITAYEDGSLALAQEVRRRNQKVKQMHSSMLHEMLTHMEKNPEDISAGTHLLFIGKNLERIGDLVSGIAGQVVFIQTGEMPGNLSASDDVLPDSKDPDLDSLKPEDEDPDEAAFLNRDDSPEEPKAPDEPEIAEPKPEEP